MELTQGTLTLKEGTELTNQNLSTISTNKPDSFPSDLINSETRKNYDTSHSNYKNILVLFIKPGVALSWRKNTEEKNGKVTNNVIIYFQINVRILIQKSKDQPSKHSS